MSPMAKRKAQMRTLAPDSPEYRTIFLKGRLSALNDAGEFVLSYPGRMGAEEQKEAWSSLMSWVSIGAREVSSEVTLMRTAADIVPGRVQGAPLCSRSNALKLTWRTIFGWSFIAGVGFTLGAGVVMALNVFVGGLLQMDKLV